MIKLTEDRVTYMHLSICRGIGHTDLCPARSLGESVSACARVCVRASIGVVFQTVGLLNRYWHFHMILFSNSHQYHVNAYVHERLRFVCLCASMHFITYLTGNILFRTFRAVLQHLLVPPVCAAHPGSARTSSTADEWQRTTHDSQETNDIRIHTIMFW